MARSCRSAERATILIHRVFDDYRFALVEPLTCEALPEAVPAIPLLPEGLEECAHMMPALIDLGALPQQGREALIAWIETSPVPPIGALLATDADCGRIMRHLARQLVVRLADGTRSLLRVHDPRVLANVRWILDERQRMQLLGPVRRWHYWREGRWRVLESSGAGSAVSGTAALGESQCTQLWRIETINAFFAQHGAAQDEDKFISDARALCAYIGRAQAYGWRKRAGWLAFAQLCFECHPKFDTHPRIVELIARLDEDEAHF